MLGSLISAAFLGASFAFASPLNNTAVQQWDCGTTISEEKLAAAEQEFARFKASAGNPPKAKAAPATIPVYFHVIIKDAASGEGNVSNSQILNQIAVLNRAYSAASITFALKSVDRTVNADWFNPRPYSWAERQMKQSLFRGNGSSLNFYSVGNIPLHLGYATFPFEYHSNPVLDGVVMYFQALPGGNLEHYNLGKIGVHEVGHWTGLYHTFHGGCDGGDFVEDTPAEESPARTCDETRDTCRAAGRDPVRNFMDYTDNNCMNQFTPGQVARLRDQLELFRGIPI